MKYIGNSYPIICLLLEQKNSIVFIVFLIVHVYPFNQFLLYLQLKSNSKSTYTSMTQNHTISICTMNMRNYDGLQHQGHYFPYILPYIPSVHPINDFQLYLNLKQILMHYQKVNGIVQEPKCQCSHKTVKTQAKNSYGYQIFEKEEKTKYIRQDQTQREKAFLQKEGRNANSNFLRMFFRRLQYKTLNHQQSMDKLIRKLDLDINLQDFQQWLKGNKVDFRNYIRLPNVKKLFMGQNQDKDFSRFLRICLSKFLREEAHICYLTSRKLKKQTLKVNLHTLRTFMNELYYKK